MTRRTSRKRTSVRRNSRRNTTRYTTRTPVRQELRVDEHSSEAEIAEAWRSGRIGTTTLQRIQLARPAVYRKLCQLAQNGRRNSHHLRRNTAGIVAKAATFRYRLPRKQSQRASENVQ